VHARGQVTRGVDTTVHLEGRLYGKAADEHDARRMLGELAGRAHTVVSGICLLTDSTADVEVASTRVAFRRVSARDIGAYLSTGEWVGRAGAYAIQGLGGRFVERLDGDYLNVVGLPGALLVDLLERRVPDLLAIGGKPANPADR
jgi:septum formation protein